LTNKEKSTTKANRIHWMDNLRTFLIFLVVAYHAAGAYENSGLWASFWIVDDPATNDLVWFLYTIIDYFVMPTMFFIAGYVTPMSLDNKEGWAFFKSRFRRLIIPWIIAVLTLIPLYKVIFLYSRGLPQENWTTYFHFSSGNIESLQSQNWLWFLPLLFLFNVLYLLLSKANIRIPNISLKGAVLGTFLIGLVYSFAVGWILGFRSWTETVLIDFENERLLLYFMVFLLGSLCFRQKAFASQPTSKRLYLLIAFTVWIPIMINILVTLVPLFVPAGFVISPVVDRLIYWLSFYVSMFCLMYLAIETFWRYVDRTGKLWNELNRNSYYVYIIHVIVIGVIALLLLNTAMPSLLKYLTLTVTAYVASNLIVSLVRRAANGIRAMRQPKS
jgi:fucose 4-O-acetylase-like acetyltransferase